MIMAKDSKNQFRYTMKPLFLIAFSLFVFSGYSQVSKTGYKKSYAEIKTGETDHENAVSVATGIVSKVKGKMELVIKIKIHPEYHIYAFVPDEDPYIKTEIKIELPAGYTKTAEFKKPSFKYFSESGSTIYEDEVMFIQEITGSGPGEAICLVTYQCCDAHKCFPPVIDQMYKVQLH